jgi:hypothetical protein
MGPMQAAELMGFPFPLSATTWTLSHNIARRGRGGLGLTGPNVLLSSALQAQSGEAQRGAVLRLAVGPLITWSPSVRLQIM